MTLTDLPAAPHVDRSAPAEALIKEARRRSHRRRLVVGALAAVATGCLASIVVALQSAGPPTVPPHRVSPSTSPTTPTSTPPPAPLSVAAPPCATADLTVTNEGNVGGAGSWGDLYTFRNVSQRTCSLTGYARIELRTGAGVYRPLQEVTAKSFPGFPYFGMRTTGRVTFANLHARTGVASFWIVSHDVPVGSGSGQVCHVALAISITPPRSATALSLGFARDSGLDWCGTSIGVTPIVVGNSGTLPYRPRSFFFP